MVPLLTSPLAIVALATIILFAGIVLLVLGFRGRRIDDHPVCRKCGFDLFGLPIVAVPVAVAGGTVTAPPPAPRCPECGADVTRDCAVRVGQRRRRWGCIAGGSTLILLLLGAAGVVGWATASKFNWQSVKPVWLLLDEARGGNPKSADAALAELKARVSRDANPAELLRSLVPAALDEQSEGHRRWDYRWGDLIEAARDHGVLTPEQEHRYGRNAIRVRLEARSRVRVGDTLPVAMILEKRVALRPTVRYELMLKGLSIVGGDGVGASVYTCSGLANLRPGRWPPDPDELIETMTILPSVYPSTPTEIHASVAPGQHHLSALVSIRVTREDDARSTGFYPDCWRSPEDAEWAMRREAAGEVMCLWEAPLDAMFDVVPVGAENVELVTDELLLSAVRAGTSVRIEKRLTPAECRVEVQQTSIEFAFDVIQRCAGTEHRLGSYLRSKPGGQDYVSDRCVVQGPSRDEDYVIVLRPSREAARRTVGLTRIWGRELVFRGDGNAADGELVILPP